MDLITPEAYHQAVHKVCELLQGRAEPLLRGLRAEMEQAAENLEFEKAATLRDQIRAVERTVSARPRFCPAAAIWTPWACSRRTKAWLWALLLCEAGRSPTAGLFTGRA